MNPAQLELVRAFTDAGGSLWIHLVHAARTDGMVGAGCASTLTVLFILMSRKLVECRREFMKTNPDAADAAGTAVVIVLSIIAVIVAGWHAVDNIACVVDPEACAAWKLAGKVGS